MRACASCGHENRPGVFFCENCGASLIARPARDTNSLQTGATSPTSARPAAPSAVADAPGHLPDARVEGRSVVREGDKLKLEIEDSPEPVTLSATQEIIFGRRDPATGALPDLDLTPHAGYRMGVSRRHAAIRPGVGGTLDLWDLGSSNGTFLNGQRLSAHRPYRLHDGDELRLGQMVIRVAFLSGAEGAPPAPQVGEAAGAPGPAREAQSEKEPPSTEPVFALIEMLREQAAAEASAALPTTEPLPELVEGAEAEKPVGIQPERPAAAVPAASAEGATPDKPAAADAPAPAEPAAATDTPGELVMEQPSEPAADKPRAEETPPAPAAAPFLASEATAAPSAPAIPLTPPIPLPKSANGPSAGGIPAPNARPIFPPGETPGAPDDGQSASAEPPSPAPAAAEPKAEAAPPAPPAADEKPSPAPDAAMPPAPPAADEPKAEAAPPAPPVADEKPSPAPDTAKPPTPPAPSAQE